MDFEPYPSPEETIRLFLAGELALEIATFHGYVETGEDPFIAQCVALHNSGEIDLLTVVGTQAFADLETHAFFRAQSFYCDAIPKLEADSTELMRCCNSLVKKAAGDGAAHLPRIAFRTWCGANPDQGREIIEHAKDGDELALDFLALALVGLGDMPSAVEFVNSTDKGRQLSGISALANMKYSGSTSALEAVETLRPFISKTSDDRVRSSALSGAFDILWQHYDPNIASELVSTASDEAGPNTLFAMAGLIGDRPKLLDGPTLETVLSSLRALSPDHPGTMRVLDHGLRRLLETANREAALDYLTFMFREGGLSIGSFPGAGEALAHSPPQQKFELLVRWLSSDIFSLRQNVRALVPIDSEALLAADASDLGLSQADLISLSRRLIGFLFITPMACCAAIVSLLRVADADASSTIARILFDAILANFGGATRRLLEGLPAEDPAKAAVEIALSLNKRFHEGLDRVPPVKELMPTEHQRVVAGQHSRDGMQQAHKAAEKKSIFADMFRRSTILHGKRSMTFMTDPGGKRQAITLDMQSFSSSVEIPRQSIHDPVGLDMMLRAFRLEGLS